VSALPQTTEGGTFPIAPNTALATQPSHAAAPPQREARLSIPEDALIVLPVPNVVMFPGTIFPITVSRPRSHAATLGIAPEALENPDIHSHEPAGATPKDGAGVAMYVALTSLLTGRPVRNDVAMTGEISPRGLVLPIGGVKEKVLAALRAGITIVMLPARNERDLEDIPAQARAQLTFVWLKQVGDAIKVAVADFSPGTYPPRSNLEFDPP